MAETYTSNIIECISEEQTAIHKLEETRIDDPIVPTFLETQCFKTAVVWYSCDLNPVKRLLEKVELDFALRNNNVQNESRSRLPFDSNLHTFQSPTTDQSITLVTPLTGSSRIRTFASSGESTPFRRQNQSLATPSSKPNISFLGIFAAKKMSRRFMATLNGETSYDRPWRKFSMYNTGSTAFRFRPATFQLRPSNRFRAEFMQSRIDILLEKRAQNMSIKYSALSAAAFSKRLADEIKFVMRTAGFDRYRFIVFCVVLEQAKQTCAFGCRSLWDTDTDTVLSSEMSTPAMQICCTVFAVYKD